MATARTLLLDEAVPLLTLTGPGGVGKTWLALAIAGDVTSHFADGVTFVDLSSLADAGLVAATVAATLGVTTSPERTVAEAIAAQIRAAQRLLILDNCEHVLAAAGELVATLLAGCPALQVLATSRAPLHIRGEQLLPVEPLPLPAPDASPSLAAVAANEAVALFADRARGVRPSFQVTDANAATVTAIVAQLDGLPLAIELAAARLRIFPPDLLLAQMSDRLLLLADGPRDLPARQQTIRDTIAWSYGLLDPATQRLFRQLAVFAGGFTWERARAVATAADGAEREVLTGLAALVDQALVRQVAGDGEARFTMLETIREFGRERLTDHEEDAETQSRHAEYFVELAEAAELHLHGIGSYQAGWMARMDAELGNLRAAMAYLLGIRDGMRALRLVVGIEAFIGARLIAAEARRWAETSLALAPDAPVELRAAALYGLITRTGVLGDAAASLAAAEAALVLAETTDDPFVLGRAHVGLGMAFTHGGDNERRNWPMRGRYHISA